MYFLITVSVHAHPFEIKEIPLDSAFHGLVATYKHLYIFLKGSNNNTEIYEIEDLGSTSPNLRFIGETPKDIIINERKTIDPDEKYVYAYYYNYSNPEEIGLVIVNMSNPEDTKKLLKSDGSPLKTHYYLHSVEFKGNKAYIPEYHSIHNACIYYANIGEYQFQLFKNITEEWINQYGVSLGIDHLHSIRFNTQKSRLYFSWNLFGGWVNMSSGEVIFLETDDEDKRRSFVCELEFNENKEMGK